MKKMTGIILYCAAFLMIVIGLAAPVTTVRGEPQSPAFDCSTVTDVPKYECEALVALYNNTNGDDWTENTGWLSDPEVCDWVGVSCEATAIPKYIVGLNLYLNNLTGGIPAELSNLWHLNYLNLADNQLTGAIPTELGNLSYLEYLFLSYNQLTGTIPPELGSLSSLQYIYLYGNQLSGGIAPELGNLSSLQHLYLYDNQLTGGIPPEFGNLSSLIYLNLSDNQLSGGIPPELGDLSSLQGLYLYGNQLTGAIPTELGNLTYLQYLALSFNQLSGTIPTELGNLSNLGTLNLDHNQLSGAIPPELGDLSSLQGLSLSVNQLSGAIPPELGNLSYLEYLSLSINQLSGSIPPELGNLSYLEYLALSFNQLSGAIPPELGDLSSLQYLALNSNQLTGAIPAELGDLSSLQELYLSGNQLSDGIPPALGDLSSLQFLSLYDNQLSGAIPPELGNLSYLEFLYLDNNALSGPVPSNLVNVGSASGIISLYLDYNALFSTDPAVTSFLETHNPTFFYTQTVAPGGFVTDLTGVNWVDLDWTPIRYTEDGGYYEVSYATDQGGPYTVAGTTTDKTATGYTVTGLSPNTQYFFRVRTFTPAHDGQQNDLWSGYAGPISATTKMPAAFDCSAVSGIPEAECQALAALYNSTGGDDWTDNSGWLDSFSPCEWYGVTCGDGHVIHLLLGSNHLEGVIPTELAQLSQLRELFLDDNQLRGPLPASLGDLNNLIYLNVQHNLLEGTIPPELGTLSQLEMLHTPFNRLSGAIPSQLGDLSNLSYLYLNHNALSGPVPTNLISVGSALPAGESTELSLDYNALYTNDASVGAFLFEHNPNFFETQTVAPDVFVVDSVGPSWVVLGFVPIPYKEDGGYYEVSYAMDQNGPYTVAGTTADKWAQDYTVYGLSPGTEYYFRMRTFTPAHDAQQNDLWSGYTSPLQVSLPPVHHLFLPLAVRN